MNKYLPLFLVALVVVGTGAFYGGMKYQQKKITGRQFNQNFAQNGTRGQFRQGLGQNGQAIRGEILNTDDKSITVKSSDGSSKIVILSDKTSVTESTSAATTALKAGEQVIVFGSVNSDGSVTAQNIQINPQKIN